MATTRPCNSKADNTPTITNIIFFILGPNANSFYFQYLVVFITDNDTIKIELCITQFHHLINQKTFFSQHFSPFAIHFQK